MRSSPSKCPRRLVDDHFAGRISPPAERALRTHLGECAECRAYYERHLVLSEIDPRGKEASERIAVGLAIAPRSRGWIAPPLAAAACVCALALCLVIPLHRLALEGARGEFAARGSAPAADPELFVYRMPGADRLRPAATVRAHDDLAFAYANPSGFRRLLVFGVDEHRHVFWYHPAWTSEAEDPHAIEVAGGGNLHELPAAIAHDLDGRKLTVFALFTDLDLSVRQIEELVLKKGTDGTNGPALAEGPLLAEGKERRLELTVEP